MDKTILNILFGWKGSVTSREFRAGLSVLFLSLGSSLTMYTGQLLFSIDGGSMDVVQVMRLYHLRDILYNFIPTLVPFYFILSYSSFVLLVKRMRSLTSNVFVTVLAGIVGFVFFASFFAEQKIGMYTLFETDSSGYSAEIWESLASTLSPIMLSLMLVGLIVFIILIFSCKENTQSISNHFDATKYALYLGNLIVVSIGIAILIILAYIVFGEIVLSYFAYNPWTLYLIVGIPHLILFILFVQYVVNRLKDAGRSFWWAVGVIGGFVAITALAIWGINEHWNITILYFVYQLCITVYVAGVYALFLLPTKVIEQHVGENDR